LATRLFDAYWAMESVTVLLHKATEAEDSYAICMEGDGEGTWRAQRGYGRDFERVWSVELQSESRPSPQEVDWEAVLGRMIEAYDMNDPLITDFSWPERRKA
jgi:hypothetical protein